MRQIFQCIEVLFLSENRRQYVNFYDLKGDTKLVKLVVNFVLLI